MIVVVLVDLVRGQRGSRRLGDQLLDGRDGPRLDDDQRLGLAESGVRDPETGPVRFSVYSPLS